MRRKLLLSIMVLFLLLSLCFVVSVEASSTTWIQTYGGTNNDQAYSLVATSDGGYAIAGHTRSSGAGGYDFWLVKTDVSGNMEWSKTYGGKQYDSACSLVETSDGGYAIAGETRSFGAGGYDFLLVKTDAFGNMEWNQTYGGPGHDIAKQLITTSDGGYAIAGGYNGTTGADLADCWLVKTDAFGNMEWNQTYRGTKYETAHSLVETSDGGYVIVGVTNSFGAGYSDFWLIKTDAYGNMEWNRTYGGPETDIAYSLVATSDGGYAIAGETRSFGTGESDFLLVKTDAFGNMEWNKTYGRIPPMTFNFVIIPCSLVATSDGGYAIAGVTDVSDKHDFWLVKTDELGNMEWNRTYGGIGWDRAYSLVETFDGGYAMAGSTISYYSGEYESDSLLIKTDALGNIGYELYYSFGYDTYTMVVSSNSTIDYFFFDLYHTQINFNVAGPNGTTGFCEVTIPEDLLWGDFPVYLNGTLLVEGVDYTNTYNGTHNIFYITYNHSAHMIEIIGTYAIPEYSSWLLPSLLLAATFVIIIYKKKLLKPRS